MTPIHIAKLPHTLDLKTVRGLAVLLQELIDKGHGETSIMRADIEAGPCAIHSIDLYDTTEELTRGETSAPLTFIIS